MALFLVPLITLTALWGFAANETFGAAVDQRNWEKHEGTLGERLQRMFRETAQERLESVMFAGAAGAAAGAGPAAGNGRATMDAQRRRTDAIVAETSALFRRDDVLSLFPTSGSRIYIDDTFQRFARLGEIRQAIDSGGASRFKVMEEFNALSDSLFRLTTFMSMRDKVTLYRPAAAMITFERSMEMAGRQASILGAVMASGGRMTEAERRLFQSMAANRRFLLDEAYGQMVDFKLREAYAPAFGSPARARLDALENQVVASRSARLAVDPRLWQQNLLAMAQAGFKGSRHGEAAINDEAANTNRSIYIRLGLAGGLGLVLLLLSVFLMVRFGRGLSRELGGVQTEATELADRRLPRVVDRLRRGEEVDVDAEAPPLRHGSTTEVARLAQAFSSVQRTAIGAAVGQAELRKAVGDIFLKLARRNQSLLHRQLAMLDELEHRAAPDDLDDLFKLDHLTTRMRRHAESLIILSGAAPGRGWRNPVAMIDVLRGAAGEVEDYKRVKVRNDSREGLVGGAVADVIHLLAELLENATSFSPPNTEVVVRAETVGTGFAVEIEDRGLGMSEAKLAECNERLENPPEFDVADTDQLGLFVVARLAARHDIKVVLRPSPYGGILAIVLLPHSVVVPEGDFAAYDGSEQPASVQRERAGLSDSGSWQTVPPRVPEELGHRAGDTAPRLGLSDSGSWQTVPPRAPEPPGPRAEDTAPHPGPSDSGSWQTTPPGGRSTGGGPSRPGAHRRPEPEPKPESGPPAPPRPTHAGLPVRTRQANLAPQLRRKGKAAPPPPAAPGTEVVRSPEEARSLMASMQEGWLRGRETPTDRNGNRGT
ncbi:sensor histidine kinase [Actinomadura craniellae]|uniref:sensor histidine kinase n=1 Tax=Actinomadura craniellae TaxID=2231787 RepID=UPI001314A628|nr:nitrate- and nitrite sensing domain-containing protein [Actinomadura craniellae]